MLLNKVVFCTLQFEAIHNWPNCHLNEVDFLRVPHRHMFHVKAYASVNHDDRDVEFILLKRQITEWIGRKYPKNAYGYIDLGGTSCETIATDILTQFDLVKVEVNEDNENGAIVSRGGCVMHIVQNVGPEFCFIAPVEYLDKTLASRSHLVLAHMLEEDPDYTEFYRNRSRAGDLIIMDNSAFEFGESFDPERLIALGKMCEADVLVLPDYPGKHISHTINAANKWAPKFVEAGFKCMFVPQSEKGHADQWFEGYEYAANNPNVHMIGMSILGIPNALPHISNTYARVVMTELLQYKGIFCTKHHHYLGLNTGPALEIPSLIRMGALDTIDSSGPIWAGITGHQYCTNTDSLMPSSKVLMPVNFHQPHVNKQSVEDMIDHNIQLTLQLFA